MQPGESVISPANADVTPGYFESMGATFGPWAVFQSARRHRRAPVLIIDEKLAQRFWPDQDPVGRRMYPPNRFESITSVTEKTVFLTVVGVIKDMKLHDLAEDNKTVGTYYYPMNQDASTAITFV